MNKLLLKRAIKERDDFLKENPFLYPFQEELNQAMDLFEDPVARMHVIRGYLIANLRKLEVFNE